jgi:diguanylate cyclase (GGDEF)-like protein
MEDAAPVHRSEVLPQRARIYFLALLAVAILAAVVLSVTQGVYARTDTDAWVTFLVLGASGALAQLNVARTPRDQAYYTTISFLVAGTFLLSPFLVALMAVVVHIPEWIAFRYSWYIQLFNITNHVLPGLGAWAVADTILDGHSLDQSWRVAIAGLAGSVVFVAINHALLAKMLGYARGFTVRETKLFEFGGLAVDLALAALGVVIFVLWQTNAWTVPFAIAPLVAIHRALNVPRLTAEAQIDAKTGLFNARHFAKALDVEVHRCEQSGRRLALIMGDLDHLGKLNNAYGHLAGDAALAAIGLAIRSSPLPTAAVPARFGGEEFAIILPDVSVGAARGIAENIRQAVENAIVQTPTVPHSLSVTISLGVAAYRRDFRESADLVHAADAAVYDAKTRGRNQVVVASHR